MLFVDERGTHSQREALERMFWVVTAEPCSRILPLLLAMVTDGPLIEAKESIGGYAVVEAESIEGALAVATSWPGGGAVEVRPLSE